MSLNQEKFELEYGRKIHETFRKAVEERKKNGEDMSRMETTGKVLINTNQKQV